VAPWTTDESVIVTVPEILAVPCARETPDPRIKKAKAKKILLIISIQKISCSADRQIRSAMK